MTYVIMIATKNTDSFRGSRPRPRRATQSFEPAAAIGEMIALEMRRRRRTDPAASKTGLFEDCLAAALGGQYPQQAERFHLARRLQAEEKAAPTKADI